MMVEDRLAYATHAALEAMLSEGWSIEPPVRARPHWQSTFGSKPRSAYHFILWRDSQVNLVTVPERPEIHEFLTESGLTVDAL
jgi:hypothetical protein